jgi:hypothetical protein
MEKNDAGPLMMGNIEGDHVPAVVHDMDLTANIVMLEFLNRKPHNYRQTQLVDCDGVRCRMVRPTNVPMESLM